MLKLYTYLDSITEHRNSRYRNFESALNYLASDIMQSLEITNRDEIKTSLDRAFQVYATLKIPFNHNFKKTYCYDGSSQNIDWKISALACYIIIINSNPSNEIVARAQLYFATKIKTYS